MTETQKSESSEKCHLILDEDRRLHDNIPFFTIFIMDAIRKNIYIDFYNNII